MTHEGKISACKGFTLVELAIVLVIIGLLVGGVLAGQELINTAKLNKVIAERAEYLRAMATFQAKYNALPGDYRRASTVLTGAADGDGDGIVECSTSCQGTPNELLPFWHHLSLAGIISGNYTGVLNGSSKLEPGLNIPRSSFAENAGWIYFQHQSGWVSTPFFGVRRGSYFQYGDCKAWSDSQPEKICFGQLLTPAQAMHIDSKLDDGVANRGTVYASNGLNPETVAWASACSAIWYNFGADYNLSVTTPACFMVFWTDK